MRKFCRKIQSIETKKTFRDKANEWWNEMDPTNKENHINK